MGLFFKKNESRLLKVSGTVGQLVIVKDWKVPTGFVRHSCRTSPVQSNNQPRVWLLWRKLHQSSAELMEASDPHQQDAVLHSPTQTSTGQRNNMNERTLQLYAISFMRGQITLSRGYYVASTVMSNCARWGLCSGSTRTTWNTKKTAKVHKNSI